MTIMNRVAELGLTVVVGTLALIGAQEVLNIFSKPRYEVHVYEGNNNNLQRVVMRDTNSGSTCFDTQGRGYSAEFLKKYLVSGRIKVLKHQGTNDLGEVLNAPVN